MDFIKRKKFNMNKELLELEKLMLENIEKDYTEKKTKIIQIFKDSQQLLIDNQEVIKKCLKATETFNGTKVKDLRVNPSSYYSTLVVINIKGLYEHTYTHSITKEKISKGWNELTWDINGKWSGNSQLSLKID